MSRHSRYQTIIHSTLRAAAGPLSAMELHAMLCHTGIGLATVYRVLNKSLEDGNLVSIELPSGPKRFEVAGKPPHHHFECTQCRTVFDVVGVPYGVERLIPEGFELQQQELILTGRCRECVNTTTGTK